MAAAWLDRREPERLHVARGVGRPLWLGVNADGVFFASTRAALGVLERYCGLRLRTRELGEGSLLTLAQGRVVRQARFRPPAYVEDAPAARHARTPGARLLPAAGGGGGGRARTAGVAGLAARSPPPAAPAIAF